MYKTVCVCVVNGYRTVVTVVSCDGGTEDYGRLGDKTGPVVVLRDRPRSGECVVVL